jgi:mannose-6-phosphate isomerase-like protein (cupin superfamily)
MSGWSSTKLSEIDADDGWARVRAHFGIAAFGINGWRADDAGAVVIGEHTEVTTGHEELYLVVEGAATFTLDGEEIDAPTGTLVHVADPTVRRKAVATTPETTILAIGAKPDEAFRVSEWEHVHVLYRERRYEEAAELLRKRLAEFPDQAGLHYNLACFESLAGAPAETVGERLRRAIELDPSFAEAAENDSDFDPVRDTAAYRSAIAGESQASGAGS